MVRGTLSTIFMFTIRFEFSVEISSMYMYSIEIKTNNFHLRGNYTSTPLKASDPKKENREEHQTKSNL